MTNHEENLLRQIEEIKQEDIPKVLLFDIDGVICEPQRRVRDSMILAINRLSFHKMVYFVTGNSFLKARDLLYGIKANGIFSDSADNMRNWAGELRWEDETTPAMNPKIEDTLLSVLETENISHFGNRIEWRSPRALNFSRIGRFATHEERAKEDGSWREPLAETLMMKYPDVEVLIGGKISMDICSKGANKARSCKFFESSGLPFWYFGDKTDPGGNDYPVVEYCKDKPKNKCFTSTGVDDTFSMVEEILRRV